MNSLVRQLEGPIVVLGAAGFIGTNMVQMLRAERDDVRAANADNWPDCFDGARTIFNLAAYGGYPEQTNAELIYQTNFALPKLWLDMAEKATFIHAGSSSEYGTNCAAPSEETLLTPNSDYAVAKAATSGMIWYLGKHKGGRCCNLRLYSVYGKHERETRLIPTLIREGQKGRLPPFVNPDTSRDFIHVEDVCRAFVLAALHLTPEHYGEAFNIGTGARATIREVAMLARQIFAIEAEPRFSMTPRMWDCPDWYANPKKAKRILGFETSISFENGFRREAGMPADRELLLAVNT